MQISKSWRARTVALSLICATAILGSGTSQAQAPNSRRDQQTFNPARQKAFRVSEGNIDVTFVSAERCASCESAYKLRFDIADRARGNAKQLTITDGPSQVEEIRIVNDGSRALIVGQYQSNIAMVVVVDLTAATVIDKWLCFNPSVSPDGRLVAYRKVYPVHFTEGVSDTYLVYDATRSPAENRQRDATVTDTINVGAAVYPIGSTNLSGDNTHVDEAIRHHFASSEFFWGANRKFAFADRSGGRNSVVVVDLTSGLDLTVVKVSPLETDDILERSSCQEFRDQGRAEYGFFVSNVVFVDPAANRLRVHLKYSLPDCRGPASLEVDVR